MLNWTKLDGFDYCAEFGSGLFTLHASEHWWGVFDCGMDLLAEREEPTKSLGLEANKAFAEAELKHRLHMAAETLDSSWLEAEPEDEITDYLPLERIQWSVPLEDVEYKPKLGMLPSGEVRLADPEPKVAQEWYWLLLGEGGLPSFWASTAWDELFRSTAAKLWGVGTELEVHLWGQSAAVKLLTTGEWEPPKVHPKWAVDYSQISDMIKLQAKDIKL